MSKTLNSEFQVGANAGIVGMTKEHLGLALALNVPVFVVVTKIDMCPENVLHDTMKLLVRILKSPGCRKIPVIVHSEDDVIISATNFVSERYNLYHKFLLLIVILKNTENKLILNICSNSNVMCNISADFLQLSVLLKVENSILFIKIMKKK